MAKSIQSENLNDSNAQEFDEICCPSCQIGEMRLEPKFKYEGVYDVYTCQICEHMEIDYDLLYEEE